MPQIKEYQQQVTLPQGVVGDTPRQRASESDFGGPALTQFGSALVGAGGDVARAGRSLEEQEERREVTDAHVNLMRIDAQRTLDLQNRVTKAQLGDETFSTKFNEEVNTQLQEVGARYQTRAGKQAWTRGAAELGTRFIKASGMEQAKLAGVQARENYTALVNSAQIVVSNTPMEFERLFNTLTRAIDDPTGSYSMIPAEAREGILRQAREQLAWSTMQGVIRSNPEVGQGMLKENAGAVQFLTGEAKEALEKEAKVGIHAKEVQKDHDERAIEKAQKEQERATQESIIHDLNKGTLTTQTIMNSNLDPVGEGSKEHFLKVLEAKNTAEKLPVKKDPSTFLKVLQGIRDKSITTETQIENQFAKSVENKRGIDYDDMLELRKELADLRTPEGERLSKQKENLISKYTPQIAKFSPLRGWLDAGGPARVYAFERELDQKIEEYKNDPKKNPHDLFDPSKSDFMGRPEIISKYQPSMQQLMKENADKIRKKSGITGPSGVPDELKRKEGETVQQYLDRTKK